MILHCFLLPWRRLLLSILVALLGPHLQPSFVEVVQVGAAHRAQALSGKGRHAAGVCHACDEILAAICQKGLDLRNQGVVVLVDPSPGGIGHLGHAKQLKPVVQSLR